MEKAQVISSMISRGTFDEMVNQILAYGKNHQSAYTCCANVHMVVEAFRDKELRDVVNNADMATPDGMPLAKAMKLNHGIEQERVAGMDLFPALLEKASKQGIKVFFYGDQDAILDQLEARVKEDFKGIQIAGRFSPPFRELAQSEKDDIVEMINGAGTQLLFVALGCPKQEKWMAEHRGIISASMIGVGNAFRAYLGIEKRAPMWMQKVAMEWFYRLVQNPKRLWKRYFVTNSLFLLLTIKGLIFRPSVSPSSA